MTIRVNKEGDAAKEMASALQTNDVEAIEGAWRMTMAAIADSVREDFEALQGSNDAAVLAQRGIRQLTSDEKTFYGALTKACRSEKPMEAFIDLIGDDVDDALMPTTIIEDVFKDLEDEHELLEVIEFTYTGYATKWIRNSHDAQKAVWGKITDEIKKEITSDLEVMDIDQNKLSAFCVIPLDILDMGYAFMDAYVRRVMKEALADGLESGILSGNGIDCPVGIDRDVRPEKFNGSTGAPQKEAIKVTSFGVVEYLSLVAMLAKSEKGKFRKVSEVCLVVNPFDYLSKVAPATTLLTPQGLYARDSFPFPTRVVQSVEIEDGKAVMFIPKRYSFCVGGSRNDLIEFDDSFKFLEDARTFKVITHGDGIADDNTVAIVLDISELKPLAMRVETVGQAAASDNTAVA